MKRCLLSLAAAACLFLASCSFQSGSELLDSSLLAAPVLTVVSASLTLISGVIIAVTETSASILAVSSWSSLLTCAVLTVTILCLTILSIILAVVSASLLSFCSIL